MRNGTFVRVSALALAILVVARTPAPAQVAVEVEAGPFVGGTLFLSGTPEQFTIYRQEASPLVLRGVELRDAAVMGTTAGIRIAERFSVDGMYAWVPTRLTATEGLEPHGGAVDVNAFRYGVTFAYHFAPGARVQPFAGLGVGGETVSYGSRLAWNRRTERMASLAVGSDFWLTETLSLRLNAGEFVTRFAGTPQRHRMITAGLTFRDRVE